MADVSLPLIEELPVVELDGGAAEEQGGALRQAGVDLDERRQEATDSWQGLRASFSVSGLEEPVWTGLDLLEGPVTDWRTAMAALDGHVGRLAAAARSLRERRMALAVRRVALASAAVTVTEETAAALRHEIHVFNADCDEVVRDWTAAQQDFASALRGITGGEADELAPGGLRGEDGLDWQGVYGDVTRDEADDAWMLLSGLNRTETKEWLDAHPEAAAVLAARGLDAFRAARTQSSRIRAVQRYLAEHDPHNVPGDVDRMAELWNALTPAEQKQLLYQYPAVFGSLNGVPFNDRGRVNQVTVRGLLTLKEAEVKDLERRRAELSVVIHENTHPRFGVVGEGLTAHSELHDVEEALADAKVSLEGLKNADAAYERAHHPADPDVEPGYDTLYVSAAGSGTIVTARGRITARTERVIGFTPGTTTTMKSARDYNGSLDGMDGHDPSGTYSIYWAGTQLPPGVTSNLNGRYNREGGPRLAAFDRALEVQTDTAGTDPRKVWASHSAGSAMTGSAEKQGMVLDAHVYIAPSGPGQGVDRVYSGWGDDSGDPADSLPNPETERYLIQNPEDDIAMAQGFQPAQSALGGTTWINPMGGAAGSSRPDQVFDDVVLLESGAVFDDAGRRVSMVGDGAAGGHSDYLLPKSLSLLNVEGVLYESTVYPEVGMEKDWFLQKDPLRERPDDFDTLQDFDRVPLDQAYLEATGRPRRK